MGQNISFIQNIQNTDGSGDQAFSRYVPTDLILPILQLLDYRDWLVLARVSKAFERCTKKLRATTSSLSKIIWELARFHIIFENNGILPQCLLSSRGVIDSDLYNYLGDVWTLMDHERLKSQLVGEKPINVEQLINPPQQDSHYLLPTLLNRRELPRIINNDRLLRIAAGRNLSALLKQVEMPELLLLDKHAVSKRELQSVLEEYRYDCIRIINNFHKEKGILLKEELTDSSPGWLNLFYDFVCGGTLLLSNVSPYRPVDTNLYLHIFESVLILIYRFYRIDLNHYHLALRGNLHPIRTFDNCSRKNKIIDNTLFCLVLIFSIIRSFIEPNNVLDIGYFLAYVFFLMNKLTNLVFSKSNKQARFDEFQSVLSDPMKLFLQLINDIAIFYELEEEDVIIDIAQDDDESSSLLSGFHRYDMLEQVPQNANQSRLRFRLFHSNVSSIGDNTEEKIFEIEEDVTFHLSNTN